MTKLEPTPLCTYCRMPLPRSSEQDHFPIPDRLGGLDVVPTCVGCHDLKDRGGWLLVDDARFEAAVDVFSSRCSDAQRAELTDILEGRARPMRWAEWLALWEPAWSDAGGWQRLAIAILYVIALERTERERSR